MILGENQGQYQSNCRRKSRDSGNRNKPWLHQECSELANKKKQAKLLGLKNLNDQATNIKARYLQNLQEKETLLNESERKQVQGKQ